MPDFVRPDGTIFSTNNELAALSAAKAGYKPAAPEDLQHAANVKEYSSPLSGARVAAERFLMGVIPDFGLGDVALRKFAPEYMKGMEGRMDAHPVLAYGAEGAGMLAGELATGGLSTGSTAEKLAAKGLSAGTRLVQGAGKIGGDFVEKKVLQKLGEGAVGTAVGKGAGFVAKNSVEGALYGLENAVSDAAIHDTELTANTLLAHMGDGALFNVGLQTGIGGLSKGLKLVNKAGQKIAEKASKFVSGAKEASYAEAYTGLRPLDSTIGTLGATAAEQKKTVRDIGKTMYDEGLTGTKSFEELSNTFKPTLDKAGEDIGKLRDQFDTGSVRPDVESIKGKLDEIYKKMESTAADQAVLKKVGKQYDDFINFLSPVKRNEKGSAIYSVVDGKRVYQREEATFSKLWEEWHGFEKQISKPGADARPDFEAIQKLIGIAKDEFIAAGERAAGEVGEEAVAKWRMANAKYSHLKRIEPLIKKGASSEINTSLASEARKVAEGPWQTAKNFVADRVIGTGPTAWSERLQNLGKLDDILKVNMDFSDSINKFANNIANNTRVATKVWDQSALATPPLVAIQRIQEMKSNPDLITAAAQTAAAPFVAQAPALGTQLMNDFQVKVNYLLNLTPKDVSGPSIIPQNPRYLAQQTKKFMDVYKAVWDPIGTINAMGLGRLSKDAIDAIRVTSPKIYAKLQEAALKAIAAKGGRLSYTTKSLYTNFFGNEADATMTQEFRNKLQQSKAPQQPQGRSRGGSSGGMKTQQLYEAPSASLSRIK